MKILLSLAIGSFLFAFSPKASSQPIVPPQAPLEDKLDVLDVLEEPVKIEVIKPKPPPKPKPVKKAVAPRTVAIRPSYYPSVYRGFVRGQCTYLAQLYRPDKFFRGNARTWIRFANSNQPKVGAVAVNTTAARGLGHVAIVLAVDGSRVKVVEMNYKRGAITERWSPRSYWSGYIH